MISHKKYIELTLKIAEKGKGYVSPNPLVGCVIVKRGKIIGRGYHKQYGGDHAEIVALKKAGKKAQNATMYINLEPCSHWGKTPPCTEKIVEAGIREVVIGMTDPNPMVDGFKEVKFRGLKSKIGILKEECEKLNEFYIKYRRTKKPFVILKVAMTMDGKIATKTGDSKYITSLEARRYVHQIRSEVDGVLVGINTVIKDNPKLTTRLVKGHDPLKIVLDSKLRMPMKCNLMKQSKKLIIATTTRAPKKKINKFYQKGVNVIVTKPIKGQVNLKELMKELGKKEMTSIMIEGGPKINSSAINERIVDKIFIFTAPKLMGNGMGAIGNLGINKINKAIKLKKPESRQVGRDSLLIAYL